VFQLALNFWLREALSVYQPHANAAKRSLAKHAKLAKGRNKDEHG
jgi:hypothetical protein